MKKTLSILLAFVLAVTSLGAGTAVFAKMAEKANVSYSVYAGKFLMEPSEIEVSYDLSDTYAEQIGYNDSSDAPTVLDALIAAHLDMFGSVKDLSIAPNGWTTSAFGMDASTFSYRVSGNYANGLTDPVKEGDYVEFMFYQDTVYWSDEYTYFNTRSAEIFKTESITLELSRVGWGEPLPAANAQITVDGKAAGKTDEKGCITLTFDKAGTYKISAENNIDGSPIFAPWCEVKVNGELLEYTQSEMKGAAKYLISANPSLDVNSAVDYLTYLKSGYDMSKYNGAFLASVKSNLDANGGKLATPPVAGYNSEMGIYGAVIQILGILGKDATNFEGYNLVEAFESIDLSASYHPYYYRAAIEAASEDFAKTLCNKYIADFYVIGSGLNYWGFSCDNTAHFLTAISKYKDDYAQYVDDAKAIIKSYTKENGAFCDAQWAPDVNSDSTALAMMAYASIGELDAAFTYYKNLVHGFEKDEIGVFGYNAANNAENAYATKDCLLALEYFSNEVENQKFEHTSDVALKRTVKATTSKNGSTTNYICVLCGKYNLRATIYSPKTVKLSSTSYIYSGKGIQPKVTVTDSKGKTVNAKNYTVKYSSNKNVGTAKVTVSFKNIYTGSLTKTFKINPKGTKLTKVSGSKKGFTAKWNKQATQTTGYQIQYATDKSFKKNVKTVTVSSNKTTSKKVSKLKAKKTYYVKIRTYKTVNGTRYYSGWSAAKQVKTK